MQSLSTPTEPESSRCQILSDSLFLRTVSSSSQLPRFCSTYTLERSFAMPSNSTNSFSICPGPPCFWDMFDCFDRSRAITVRRQASATYYAYNRQTRAHEIQGPESVCPKLLQQRKDTNRISKGDTHASRTANVVSARSHGHA